MLSPDLVKYILDPENELRDVKPNPKATLEMRFSKFNISDFEKVKNERNILKGLFKKICLFFGVKHEVEASIPLTGQK